MTQQIQLLQSEPDVWNFPGQIITKGTLDGGMGLCDPLGVNNKQAAEPFRYVTALLTFTVAAGHLVMAAEQIVTVANTGTTDDMPVLTNVEQNEVETDLYKGGSMTRGIMNTYVIQALGVQPLRGYVISGDPSTKTYAEWLDDMMPRIHVAVFDNTAVQIEYEEEDCPKDLGLIKFWPQHASLQGEQQVYNGAAMGPASVTPLRRTFISGSAKNDWSAVVNLFNNAAYRVEESATLPIPDGVTSIVLPVQILFYGKPQCGVKCFPACMLPNGEIQVVQVNGNGAPMQSMVRG